MAMEPDQQQSKKLQAGGSPPDRVENVQVLSASTEEKAKPIRHPRWTRHETLVLIEGKKAIENGIQFHKGRRSFSAFGPDPVEPKWDLVSSYCNERGVFRGPVQCRKRWSNLLVDFKKIRNRESQIKGEAESYWVMRNDLRRDKKLPGFFDREVYNVLDGKPVSKAALPMGVLCPVPLNSRRMDDVEEAAAEEEEGEEEERPERLFNSIRHDATENGLFSDNEESGQEEAAMNSQKEQKVAGSPSETFTSPVPTTGKGKRCLGSSTWRDGVSQEKHKQRRVAIDGCEDSYSDKLITILEKNGSMLNAQLAEHNKNWQLARDESKEQSSNLLAAIKNVTDALSRIADKL